MKETVLFVDDDPSILRLSELHYGSTYKVKTAQSVEIGLNIFKQVKPDVVVVDLNFEGQALDGLSFIDSLLNEKSDTPIVVLSNDSNTQRVVSTTMRPIKFVPKQGDYDNLLAQTIEDALASKRMKESVKNNAFPTKSFKVIEALRILDKIAASGSQSPVLILGETGVGKEHAAKYFAQRRNKPIICINIAATAKDLVESTLFGAKKGAFTGAHSDTIGWVEKAHRGLMFLDEIGDASMQVQAKLLRVIQEKEIQRLGSTETKKIDVQFVTATHHDLDQLTKQGFFREDLKQRLSTFRVYIPPLRERFEDIEFLTRIFVAEFSKKQVEIKDCAFEALLSHSWPGNVRELKNVVENALILSDKSTLDGDGIRDIIGTKEVKVLEIDTPIAIQKLKRTLEKNNGNRTKTAIELGVNLATIYRRIKKYRLDLSVPGRPGRPIKA